MNLNRGDTEIEPARTNDETNSVDELVLAQTYTENTCDPRLEHFEFQHPLRRYQEQIIALCNQKLAEGDRELHIVAPPGAGKTIIGLQIIAQLKRPSLVLSPNTTIQAQWGQKLDLFLPPDAAGFKGKDIVGSHEDRPLKPITVLTYQSLTTPGREAEYLNEIATSAWIAEIARSGAHSDGDARARIDEIKINNSKAYKKELGRHAARLRRKLADVLELEKVLHPNALNLIAELKREQCSLIIFDECHHLTDYWSAVMIQLVRQLEGAVVVGLTGTPPATKSALQKNRYLTLVGPIDYQVPTPALVKEGGLAAFQDLVYFTEPNAAEREFLNSQHKEFQDVLLRLAEPGDSRLSSWIIGQIGDEVTLEFSQTRTAQPQGTAGIEGSVAAGNAATEETVTTSVRPRRDRKWIELAEEQPELAIAMARYLWKFKLPLPKGLDLSESVRQSPLLDDWIRILEEFALNCLKTSADENDQQLLKDISNAIKRIGFNLSERGIKKVASPVDRVLAFSQSKSRAVANILDVEYRSLESRLRSIVVTDFERMSATAAKSVKGIMDAEAGGAFGVMNELLKQPVSEFLNPCLVTGSLVLIDKRIEQEFLSAANEYLKDNGTSIELRFEPQELSEADQDTLSEGSNVICLKVLASSQWNPRTYVALMTALFERGTTKCLIGTRGIFGEGWDSQQLNTIIDLTTSTSAVSVNQLRGRGIRLNEKDPVAAQKVANNWDVVCIAPELEKGLNDYSRFVRKHEGYFGISDDGQIECGVGHVHPSFSDLTPAEVFASIDDYNVEMLQRALIRDKVYELWEVGKPYANKQLGCVEISSLRQVGVTPPYLGMRKVHLLTDSKHQQSKKSKSRKKKQGTRSGINVKNKKSKLELTKVDNSSAPPISYEEHAELIRSSFKRTWISYSSAGAASSLALGVVLTGISVPVFFAALPIVAAIIAAKYKTNKEREELNDELSRPATQEEVLTAIATATLYALQERNFLPTEIQSSSIKLSIRSDRSFRVFLDDVEPIHCEIFIRAIEEVLAPVTNQPYIIPKYEYPAVDTSEGDLVSIYLNGQAQPTIGSYHAIPRLLARSEKGRDAFEHAWNELVSPGFVISTEKNPQLVQKFFGMGPSLAERMLWE